MRQNIDHHFRPAVRLAQLRRRVAVSGGALLLSGTFLAGQAMAAAGNTLGARMQAAAGDLTLGGGYVLELLGYILGAAAILAGGFTVWQHTKNPNGQHRLSYGIISVLVGGFFLTASLISSFTSNTISGAGSTNTGTSQQLIFQ